MKAQDNPALILFYGARMHSISGAFLCPFITYEYHIRFGEVVTVYSTRESEACQGIKGSIDTLYPL